MPSKRERGKQRKAVKDLAAGNGNDSITQIVAKVKKGDHDTTILLADHGSIVESNGICYEQSGILSTVLKFLKRCEDMTFAKVLLDVGGGDLVSPQVWLRVLIKAEVLAEVQEPNSRLHIAQNIGPLVRCMCADTARLLFKSNKHWVDTTQAFVALIHNMILHSFNMLNGKEIIDTLFQYEGLLTSIIQWGFWEKEYRPDITKELLTEERVNIVRLGKATLNRVIAATENVIENRQRMETIGTTPIISQEYDPECKISLVVGLIRQVKNEGWTMNTSLSLGLLVSCVDKDVITELIDLGISTSDDKWAAHVAGLLNYMILKRFNNEKWYANDTKVAFAIRGGLIELCLLFVERFGVLESFDMKKDNLPSPLYSIKMILANMYWIRLNRKTSKAIRSKRLSIEQVLARLEQNTDITNDINCKKLLEMVRSILNLDGSYCCRCNKSLSKTEVKLCNGCGCMAYCSRACQKEDWLNGHKVACCKSYTPELSGRFQGRFIPIVIPEDERKASKLKELEVNMNMIQLKLFLDHKESILSQANALDLPLYDCIVKFDLTNYPLEVTTKKYTEYFDSPELKRGFEDSRSKKNTACFFISKIYDGDLIEGQIPTLKVLRLFPHEWLTNGRRSNGLVTTN